MKKKPTIKELKEQNFKRTVLKDLYLTNTGKAYNYTSKREITPTKKGKVVINNKSYNLAKLLLQTFKNIPVRNGYIKHIDKNKSNFNIDNLEYVCTIKEPTPKETDIITCIRLYFSIPIKFKVKNLPLFKFYIFRIITERGFVYRYKDNDFNLFIDWLNSNMEAGSKSINSLSKKYNYPTRNIKNIINKYLGLLVTECLQDYENSILEINDYQPKPLTETKKRKILLDKLGLKPKKTANQYSKLLNKKIK